MAGGTIFSKTINSSFQGGADKNLIINANYAYVAPFTFETGWNEIQIGVLMSFVKAGAGNENIGFPSANNHATTLGGNANDEFFYFGIGRTGETQSLPSGAANSGFIGVRNDGINFFDSPSDVYNRMYNIQEAGGTYNNPHSMAFASSGTTVLETGFFDEHKGNWVCIGGASSAAGGSNLGTSLGFESGAQSSNTSDGCTESAERFMSYWGARFAVKNKGTSNQKINFTAQGFGTGVTTSAGVTHINGAISDPTTGTLSNLLDNAGTTQFNDSSKSATQVGGAIHSSSDGFIYNHGGAAIEIPNALYIYNGFTTVSPRIHAWGVKVIS
jgi:hypothetical protein